MSPSTTPRHARALALLAAAGALASCEQTEQLLPFDASGGTVSRPVPASGGTVSSAAGASFKFPAGALASGGTVTLSTVATPADLGGATAASAFSFAIDGGGAALSAPFAAELRFGTADPRAWLVSAVVGTPGGMREIGDASGDLAVGILRTRIGRFGTVTAVYPAPAAIVPVGRFRAGALASAAPSTAAADAPMVALLTSGLRGACGGAGQRCAGLEVQVSENLLEYADTAAIVFAEVGGQMTFVGTTASGSLFFDAPLRMRLNSGDNFVTIPVRVTVTATSQTAVSEVPGTITLRDVQVDVDSPQGGARETMTLTVTYQGTAARVVIQRGIGATLGSVQETATFAARIPLVRVP